MSPALTTIISITSLLIAVIAVTISAVSAYRTHFWKDVSLVLNLYDDVLQEDADLIMLLTNQGNVSLAIPWINIGKASKDGMRTTLPVVKSLSGTSIEFPQPLIKTRSAGRIIKPGDHLEFLLKIPQCEGEMEFLRFETVTGDGVSLYFEERFSHRISVQLSPTKLRINKPPVWSRHESIYIATWKRTKLDAFDRRKSFVGWILDIVRRRKNENDVGNKSSAEQAHGEQRLPRPEVKDEP